LSNPTGAFGLRPVRHMNGAPWNGATVPCYVSAAYNHTLFIGDPVLQSPTAAEKMASGLYLTINQSAGTDGIIILGVIVSFEPLYSDLTKIYNPAVTERIANVCMDPSVVYEVRGNGAATPEAAQVGANASLIATTSGSTVTGLSGFQLDEGTTSDPRVNQSNPLLIVGASSRPDESPLSTYTLWEVVLNTPYNATGLVLGVTGS
jgi:hypothetical protein